MVLSDGRIRQSIESTARSLEDAPSHKTKKVFPGQAGRLDIARTEHAELLRESGDPGFKRLLQYVIIL
jgi:hypothetical protein